MGDHRITLSIKAEFHGKTYEIKEAWWNWSGPEVDSRVKDFFESMWEDGYSRWLEGIRADQKEQNKAGIEKEERAQLAKLKAKYE